MSLLGVLEKVVAGRAAMTMITKLHVDQGTLYRASNSAIDRPDTKSDQFDSFESDFLSFALSSPSKDREDRTGQR